MRPLFSVMGSGCNARALWIGAARIYVGARRAQ